KGGAASKLPTAGDLDDELTFTEPVVPGLVGCNDREVPGEQPSAWTLASALADLEVSGRGFGVERVVVHLDPRHRQVHGSHGSSLGCRTHVRLCSQRGQSPDFRLRRVTGRAIAMGAPRAGVRPARA